MTSDGTAYVTTSYEADGRRHHLAAAFVDTQDLDDIAGAISRRAAQYPQGESVYVDLYAAATAGRGARERRSRRRSSAPTCRRSSSASCSTCPRRPAASPPPTRSRCAASIDGGWELDRELQFVHPEMAERLNLWRMSEFALERIASPADVYLFRGVGRSNPKDERLFALAEVREITIVRDENGRVVSLPELEHMLAETLESLRRFQARRSPRERLLWNRVRLNLWPAIDLAPDEAGALIDRYARETEGLGIETVIIRGRMRDPRDGVIRDSELRLFAPAGRGVIVEIDEPATRPLQPLDEGARRIVQARRRGSVHPAELVKVLAPERRDPARVDPARRVRRARPRRRRRAGPGRPLAGDERRRHRRRPDALLHPPPPRGHGPRSCCSATRRSRWAASPSPSAGGSSPRSTWPRSWACRSSGSRCRPGARISMDSGTENMDWVAAALRRIIEFTQHGGEINVVVTGINVGAQPYWNAEATMLMHTRGILVMTPESAMVLTGKQALDFAGGVSAEDNFGIGGYDRIMGPNGQAQYWARDLAGACGVLHRYYDALLRRARRALPAPRRDPRRARARRAHRAAFGARLRARDGRRHLLRRDEPGPQAGVRHPLGDEGGRR